MRDTAARTRDIERAWLTFYTILARDHLQQVIADWLARMPEPVSKAAGDLAAAIVAGERK